MFYSLVGHHTDIELVILSSNLREVLLTEVLVLNDAEAFFNPLLDLF